MPGRKEQNKRDLKKASANCYQLDEFINGIRKTVNESKNSFSENQNRSTPISLDLTNSSQDIPCTSKENNSPCSEHILNEEFQSSQLILSRQQTSLGNFDFNVDLEPGSPPSPASPAPPVSPPPGYPQSPNSQQLPDSPQSTDSLQSLDSPQPPVSQLSPLSSSTSEPPNGVLNEPLAANACRNQKNVSPNQPVNFKYPKREYKDSNRSFQPHWCNDGNGCTITTKKTVQLAIYAGMLICITCCQI